jgi:hypothetical protein
MGSWTAAVFTKEQQARLGVSKAGSPSSLGKLSTVLLLPSGTTEDVAQAQEEQTELPTRVQGASNMPVSDDNASSLATTPPVVVVVSAEIVSSPVVEGSMEQANTAERKDEDSDSESDSEPAAPVTEAEMAEADARAESLLEEASQLVMDMEEDDIPMKLSEFSENATISKDVVARLTEDNALLREQLSQMQTLQEHARRIEQMRDQGLCLGHRFRCRCRCRVRVKV